MEYRLFNFQGAESETILESLEVRDSDENDPDATVRNQYVQSIPDHADLVNEESQVMRRMPAAAAGAGQRLKRDAFVALQML